MDLPRRRPGRPHRRDPALLDRLLPDDAPAATASAPPPAASPSVSPTPVAFQLTSATSVPQCADITGYGSKPPGREVGLFIRVPGDSKYYWEKILTFDGDSWRADRVVIGAPGDAGKEFELVLVPMSVQAVVEFRKHDGTPYAVDNPPVTPSPPSASPAPPTSAPADPRLHASIMNLWQGSTACHCHKLMIDSKPAAPVRGRLTVRCGGEQPQPGRLGRRR
ncbi:hypothetical protein ACFQZ4_32980 [Catellatospora coxensis]